MRQYSCSARREGDGGGAPIPDRCSTPFPALRAGAAQEAHSVSRRAYGEIIFPNLPFNFVYTLFVTVIFKCQLVCI